MKKKYTSAKELANDFAKACDRAARRTAVRGMEKMTGMYQSAISAFYSDYAPTSYKRTYNLYTGTNMYGSASESRGISRIPGGYAATLRVGSEFLQSDYEADKAWVYGRSFIEGIHGFTEGESWADGPAPPVMSPAPKELMDESFKGIRDGEIKAIFKDELKKA